MKERMQVVIVGLLAGTVSLVAWYASVKVERAAIRRTVDRVATGVQNEIESRLASRTEALERMADRWARRGGTPKDEWESDATSQFEHFKCYQAIEWVDQSFRVRWIVPLAGNEAVLGMESAFEPVRRKALEQARDRRIIAYTDPIDLVQGGKGFLVYVPIFVGDEFEGFILGVYKVSPLFDQILPRGKVAAGYGIRVSTGDDVIYYRGEQGDRLTAGADDPCRWVYRRTVTLGAVSLDVDICPSDATLEGMFSILPHVVLFGGLSISCLLTVIWRLGQVTRDKSRQLSRQLSQAHEQVSIEADQREIAQEELSQRVVAIEASFDGIAVLDGEGRYTYMNRSHARIYGYESPDDLIGKTWEEMYFPEEIDRIRSEVFASLEQNGQWHGELRGKKLGGEQFPVEVSLTSLPAGGLICICHDITDRKAAEHALRESEGRLQGILDNTTAVVYMKDLQGRYLLVNRQFEMLFDVSRDQVRGKTDHDIFPTDMADAFRENDEKVARDGGVLQMEEIAPHNDGPHTYVSVKFPMRDTSGEIYALAGISTDITELKNTEMALRESEQRFDLAVRGSQAGLWDWFDVENDEVWWSPRLYEMLGYNDDEVPSTLGNFSDLLHPEDRDRTFDMLKGHLERGEPFDIEYRLKTKGGTYKWFRARGESVRDGSGKSTRMAGSIQDVSDRKLAEQELRRSARQLEKNNRELEDFVHTVSHDLKSPLVSFMGFLSHLSTDVKEGRTDRLSEYIGYLNRAAVRMRDTVRDLLEISTIGRVVNEDEEIDVRALVESVVEDLTDVIRDTGAVVRIEEPIASIKLDVARLRQVFQNLLGNALKYGCEGDAPEVRVGGQRFGDEVRFYVADDGPGIAPAYQQKIFGIFQRLSSSERGTGVGLAIVMRVAEIYNGRAWVESDVGQGATFWVAFPVKQILAEDNPDESMFRVRSQESS